MITNCENFGKVFIESESSTDKATAGGIIGELDYSCRFISYCANRGVIWGQTAGSIVGDAGAAPVLKCVNSGTISDSPDVNISASVSNLGGIVGFRTELNGSSPASIGYCYNSGTIIATDEQKVANMGGIVGFFGIAKSLSATVKGIDRCYNSGVLVTANKTISAYMGGIAGRVSLFAFSDVVLSNSFSLDIEAVGHVQKYSSSYRYSKIAVGDLSAMATLTSDTIFNPLGIWVSESDLNGAYPALSFEKTNGFSRGIILPINYVMNGGTLDESGTDIYKYGTAYILPAAYKDGFEFMGWFLNEQFTQRITEVPAQNTDSIKIYAKFAVNLENVQVQPLAELQYSGYELTPDVEMSSNGLRLVKNVDYTLEYSDNINLGTALVIVNGIGNFTGTIYVPFDMRVVHMSEKITTEAHQP